METFLSIFVGARFLVPFSINAHAKKVKPPLQNESTVPRKKLKETKLHLVTWRGARANVRASDLKPY